MRTLGILAAAFALSLLSACVTINVYFPAAEAQAAAKEFVDRVIGEEEAEPADEGAGNGGGGAAPGFSLLSIFISSAHAQSANIDIKTPAIQAIQSRMAERFDASLRAQFDAGALGFGSDGMLVVRDAAAVPLRERSALNQAVADDNRDRKAVYREIAVANGHPEWEQQIRETFAKQWIASAKAGWWYQTSGGEWKQK